MIIRGRDAGDAQEGKEMFPFRTDGSFPFLPEDEND
jgi:hypothetical protein